MRQVSWWRKTYVQALVLLLVSLSVMLVGGARAVDNPQSGSVGIEGTIPANAPTQPAVISFPTNNSNSSTGTITVTGLCPNGSLVKIFKNNVFAGAVQCKNGSFSIQIDLFNGVNEIIARVYNELDEAGPDSNTVIVNYNIAGGALGSRVSLTSNYAKRGAGVGQTLIWPIALSGGDGPYAISVDWGDGTPPDIISQQFAGNFNISHVYTQPGVYTVIIRAVDKNGNIAFLQLVGVANGALSQDAGKAGSTDDKNKIIKIIWWPLLITIPLILIAFWLGKRHQLFVLKKKLNQL